MNSIEEVFDNSNQLIDGIHHFFDRYIGNSLLRKCGIHKIVDKIMSKGYEYPDSPLLRLLGKNLKDSPILRKVVKAKDLLIDKILLPSFVCQMMEHCKPHQLIEYYEKYWHPILDQVKTNCFS